MGVTSEFVLASIFGAADEEELRAIRIGVLDGIIVKILIQRIAAIMPATRGVGLNWPGTLHPAAFVNLVDVEIAENSSTGPEITVEMADLIAQLRPIGWRGAGKGRATSHPVGAQQRDVANLSSFNLAMQFLTRFAVPDHKADADLEVLLFRFISQR